LKGKYYKGTRNGYYPNALKESSPRNDYYPNTLKQNSPKKRSKTVKKNNNKISLAFAGFFLFIIAMFSVGALSSCQKVIHVEALEGYTQTGEEFMEEANLVNLDGYYAGTGTLNNIVHVRFQAEKDGQTSDTIDATKKFFNIVYTDEAQNSQYKNLEGKVRAFKRTYKKDQDVKTHYYYIIYSSKDKIKDVGELSLGD